MPITLYNNVFSMSYTVYDQYPVTIVIKETDYVLLMLSFSMVWACAENMLA